MTPFVVAGESAPDSDFSKWSKAGFGAITPDFFKTFGVHMMKGRAFTEQDSPSNVKVAIVNEEFVRRFLNGTDPLRARVWLQQSAEDERIPAAPTEWQIVGVSHDTLSKSMREHIARDPDPLLAKPVLRSCHCGPHGGRSGIDDQEHRRCCSLRRFRRHFGPTAHDGRDTESGAGLG